MNAMNNKETTYKNTPLGKIPKDWDVKPLNDITNIIMGQSPYSHFYNDIGEGLPLIQGNADIENRKSFKRIFTTQLTKVCDEDDFILSVRAPVGNVGIASYKSCIGRGVCAIKPKNINRDYLFQLLLDSEDKWGRIQQGSTFTAVSTSDVKVFKLIISTKPSEQKRIAEVLSTWDKAIDKTQQLIAQKELRKKWLMQQLLTGKVRLPAFVKTSADKKGVGKWEEVELGNLLDYEQPSNYLVKNTLYNDLYSTPVLTAGKTFILGYTNENTGIYNDLPVIIFDDFTTVSKYVDFPFKAKSSAMKLLRPKPNVNLKFVYESMQLLSYTVGGHERHWISKFVYLTIPCPPIEEQTAIAQVLQTADKEIQLHSSKLERMKEQKKGLMQVLLTGRKRLKLN